MIKYINGQVYTQKGMKQAFAAENGKFVCVGTDEEILACEGETVDLDGAFVCAGFNDSHMHLLEFGHFLRQADLSEATGSLEEVLEKLKKHIEKTRPEAGEWAEGRGFNQDYFSGEKKLPDRWDLDRVSTEIPLMIMRACGHVCAVNSKALMIMGINRDTPSPEGGEIGHFPDGEPSGIFSENAIEMVSRAMPAISADDAKKMIIAAAGYVNSKGITSVHSEDLVSISSVDYQTVIRAYQELEAEGKLTVRVNEQCQFTGPEQFQEFFDSGFGPDFGSSMFKIGPLKIIGDGSLGASTAFLLEPYEGTDSEYGIEVCPHDEMKTMIRMAHMHGMQAAVHAIGDASMESVLQCYEDILKEYPVDDHRHGVVHCQIMTPQQYERFAAMKLHAYIQSIFLDYDIKIVGKRTGDRKLSSYCFHRFLENGSTISNGSDAPVEYPGPLAGMQCAVTRRDLKEECEAFLPEEALSVKEALDSYTVGGAYVSFEEKIKGDIAPGMLADFVILDKNPFLISPDNISSIAVKSTYLAGKLL